MSIQHASRILIVEDDAGLRELLHTECSEAGYTCQAVASAEEAQAVLHEHSIDLLVTDIRLPGADGMQLLHASRQLEPAPAVIVITAFGTVPQAVEAVRAGATDFLTKPVDLDRLRLAIDRAAHIRHLEHELDQLHGLLQDHAIPGLVGASRPMQRMLQHMQLIGRSDGPVLVTGESGAGKELVARGIARYSARRDRPFIAVNCASIPENLLESEFFGHQAGAFSGADHQRRGLFRAAHGGTLLLDEIAEMPLSMQAKLLRVLQEQRIRAVGADHEDVVDVRIIAATNKYLLDEVGAGRFREDLYYRLETFTVEVPPLRDRGEDIELLALHFLRLLARGQERPLPDIHPDALLALRRYSFPGNVRELRNIMERALTFCRDEGVQLTDLPQRVRQTPPSEHSSNNLPFPQMDHDGILPTLDTVQQRYVRHVLDQVDGNKRRAAAILGIGRRTLYRWLEEDDGA
ncbi:MAG: sigma-54-dependent Fis family transcriptional regulator [Planctomycetota bacterium]|nr:MAG: sigma-54-dependent Fis family transcriptional regulator [Planctomycetota bacterium]